MARQPQVTRTILSTNATVLCLNLATRETFEKTVSLSRTYASDEKILKAVEKLHHEEGVRVVTLLHSEVVSNLYAMSEQKFIETAELIPPRKVAEKKEA